MVGEDNGVDVHITVSTASTVFVGFGVQVEGVKDGKGR